MFGSMNVNIAASVEATDGQMLGMMEHYSTTRIQLPHATVSTILMYC
jgi:hypothetical protein